MWIVPDISQIQKYSVHHSLKDSIRVSYSKLNNSELDGFVLENEGCFILARFMHLNFSVRSQAIDSALYLICL